MKSKSDYVVVIQFMNNFETQFHEPVKVTMDKVNWKWIKDFLNKYHDNPIIEKLTICTYSHNKDQSMRGENRYDLVVDDEKSLSEVLDKIHKNIHPDPSMDMKTDKYMHFVYTFE